MRTVAALAAGIIIGVALTLAVVVVSGGWYEYHILTAGEDPAQMINQDGWQLVLRDGSVWQFRRPHVRLH